MNIKKSYFFLKINLRIANMTIKMAQSGCKIIMNKKAHIT